MPADFKKKPTHRVLKDIEYKGLKAFKKGELVVVEKVSPDPNKPDDKYIVHSKGVGRRLRLSDSEMELLDTAQSPAREQGSKCHKCGGELGPTDSVCGNCGYVNVPRVKVLAEENNISPGECDHYYRKYYHHGGNVAGWICIYCGLEKPKGVPPGKTHYTSQGEYCEVCGVELSGGKYCTNCGARIRQRSVPTKATVGGKVSPQHETTTVVREMGKTHILLVAGIIFLIVGFGMLGDGLSRRNKYQGYTEAWDREAYQTDWHSEEFSEAYPYKPSLTQEDLYLPDKSYYSEYVGESSKASNTISWAIYVIIGGFLMLGGYVYLVFQKRRILSNEGRLLVKTRIPPAGRKACPFCAELVKSNANKCRYCGSDLTQPPPSSS